MRPKQLAKKLIDEIAEKKGIPSTCGIGTNLFSNQKTVAEKYGIEKLREELAKTSEFYNNKFVYIK